MKNAGRLYIEDSTVIGSAAQYAGGLSNLGYARIDRSTFVANQVDDQGGAIRNQGGEVLLTNSTLTGNDAFRGAAIEMVISYFSAGEVTLDHTTVAGNTGPFAAVYGGSAFYGDTVAFVGSVLGENSGDNCDLFAVLTASTTLADDDSCLSVPSSLTGLDPVARDNGGPTLTHRAVSAKQCDRRRRRLRPRDRSAGCRSVGWVLRCRGL